MNEVDQTNKEKRTFGEKLLLEQRQIVREEYVKEMWIEKVVKDINKERKWMCRYNNRQNRCTNRRHI